MKQLFYIIFFTTISFYIKAQDPHFSQFFASPLTLNPAYTGKFNGNYRVSGNYRNQWPEINNAFITNTVSADFHLIKSKISPNNILGVGFMVLNDNSANSAVKFNYASISTAYHKGMNEDGTTQFGIGFQATYSNLLINTSKLLFEDQLTTSGFTKPTDELFKQNSLQSSYFDVNAGMLYSGNIGDKSSYYMGVSMYHLNKPTLKLTGTTFALNPRITLHGGAFFAFNDVVGLHFSWLHSTQGGTTETVAGGAFQLTAVEDEEKPVYVYAGSWLRLNDAIIPYIGLEFLNTRLGVSYDVNTSSLKTASLNKGGIEISLTYTNQPNTDRPINCPKF